MTPYQNSMTNLRPEAVANIHGNSANPLLRGIATFHTPPMGGLIIQVEIFHLPDEDFPSVSGFFGMHIHEKGDCSLPFDKTGDHYNPSGQMHPDHAGDLPPLLSSNGYAWMSFYDSRLSIPDIIGRSIVIHGGKDDFSSQPSGHSGDKIGCGTIIINDI